MIKRNLFVLFFQVLVIVGYAQSTPQHRASVSPALRPFYHGVASGDPTDTSLIIWTRFTPDSGMLGNAEVFWQIATDTLFQNVVNYGKLVATESNDYCVKADVCGLQPSTVYYYMFNALHRNSVTGRAKTAPSHLADNDSVRFAVVSCADYENGYFNAYESISDKNNVDAVVHLGDYIYEYEPGGISVSNPGGRVTDPDHEIVTAEDYRIRHSHYKLDYQLKRLHQLFPFITVWDDHETCNNSWRDGADNHQPATEGLYTARKTAATSTYFKWMPIRKPDPADTIRIFRKLRYGRLLDLIMLDTRLYDRDEPDLGATNNANHKLLGPVEMAWFLQQLNDTTTRWKIIGNQVMFAPLQVFGIAVNSDQWDGYNYEREQIQNNILQNNVKDVVVLTGDIHTSWCNDVPGVNYDASTGAGSVCVEFVGTSVTSQNSPLPVGVNLIKSMNPHMKYINLDDHGYYTLDVRKGRAQADYTFLSTDQPTFTNIEGVSYYVNHNERHLNQGTPVTNVPSNTMPAPSIWPQQGIPFNKIDNHYEVIEENIQVTVSVVPNVVACPAVSLSIMQGQHGGALTLNGRDVTYVPQTNYNGFDTVGLIFCTNEVPAVCDTVYLFVEILAVQDIDTITVDVDADSIYTGCFMFDDLAYAPIAVSNTTPTHGGITLNDTCFTFVPDTNYRGFDWVIFTACDTAGNCDTVVYKFKIDHPVAASLVELTLNKNTNITYCAVFDDLVCQPTSFTVIKSPAHGTYQVSAGLCLKYFPYYNYVGDDTIRIVGCDTCGLSYCDTITLVYHVQEPNTVQEVNHFIVFGMFPNPVNDKLVVQYYLYEPSQVEFNVFDVAGKLISKDEVFHPNTGLQYAQLNTLALPAGNYVVEVKAGGHTYRKKVIKE